MRVRVSLSTGLSFPADLYANPVATDLAARMPFTATFVDFNGVEKVARLDAPLSIRGVPSADAPQPGEIGYYGPSHGLVLYYDKVGRWPGLVRIGRFQLPVEELQALPDGFTARFSRHDDEVAT